MSNPISALNGRVAAGDVTVRDAGLQGMVSVRADMSKETTGAAGKELTGATLPAPGKMSMNGDNGFGWMAPDEGLLLIPYDQVDRAITSINKLWDQSHYQVTNLSDARAHIIVQGPFAHEVIAKLAPVDLHPDSFGIGDFRRSRLGQVAAAFWKSDADTFHVVCFRSVAEYAFDLLAASAQAGPVGYTA